MPATSPPPASGPPEPRPTPRTKPPARKRTLPGPLARAPLATLWLLLGAACADAAPETREYLDTGAVCLSPGEPGAALFEVTFGASSGRCLSACDLHAGACTATLVHGRVQVRTRLHVTRGTADVCTAECATTSARCSLTLPEPGDYALVLAGGRTTTATLPPTAPVPLFDQHACDP